MTESLKRINSKAISRSEEGRIFPPLRPLFPPPLSPKRLSSFCSSSFFCFLEFFFPSTSFLEFLFQRSLLCALSPQKAAAAVAAAAIAYSERRGDIME
jgi:hypothetical protein